MKIKKEISNELVYSTYNILYTNDLVLSFITEMIDNIKTQDKYTNKLYKALFKRKAIYEKEIKEILGDKIFFLAEYSCIIDDLIQDKVTGLANDIQLYLSQNNICNEKFISIAETMRVLSGYSLINIEKRIKHCLKYNKDSLNLRYYKLSEISNISKDLSKWLLRKYNDFDILKSETITTDIKEIIYILNDKRMFLECIEKTKTI